MPAEEPSPRARRGAGFALPVQGPVAPAINA
jgi:hypothetical protein